MTPIFFNLLMIYLFNNSCQSLEYNKEDNLQRIENKFVVKAFMYHRFNESPDSSTNISLKNLEIQLEEINKKFKVMTCKKYLENYYIFNRKLDKNIAIITIDDGWKSILNAKKLFDKFKFKFTLFLNMKEIDNNSPAYLSINEIRKLINDGHDIQNHTFSHPKLPKLSLNEIKNEIEYNHNLLKKHFNINSNIFSYPYGYTNQTVINILKDLDYNIAFGQHSGVFNNSHHDNYFLPRVSCTGGGNSVTKDRIKNHSNYLYVKDIYPKYVYNTTPHFICIYFDVNYLESLETEFIDIWIQTPTKGTFKLKKDKIIILDDRIIAINEYNLKRINIVYEPNNTVKNEWCWYSHYYYNHDNKNKSIDWYNGTDLYDFLSKNDVYKAADGFVRLPYGFRTNNWGSLIENGILWNERIKPSNGGVHDQVYLYTNKDNIRFSKILTTFKNPIYGIRACFIHLLQLPLKSTGDFKYTLQELIVSPYMQDKHSYKNAYKKQLNNIYDLEDRFEATNFIKFILKIEMGSFDNVIFFDLIPTQYSDNILYAGYELAICYIKTKPIYLNTFKN